MLTLRRRARLRVRPGRETSLAIEALGPMVSRFVPGGYEPVHARESTATKIARAVVGLGDLIDDYEFH
jgi:hypothetical protein